MNKQIGGVARWAGVLRQLRGTLVSGTPRSPAKQGFSRRAVQQKLLWLGGAAAALAHLPARAKDELNSDSLDPCLAAGAIATPPFVDELPKLQSAEHRAQAILLSELSPAPGRGPVIGEAKREAHQAWYQHPPQKYYELVEEEVQAKLHRDLPYNTLWGFRRSADAPGSALVPGPTFYAKCGEPVLVRIRNHLPPYNQHYGFGMPETSTHLHNNHTPWESDGNPDEYFPRLAELDPSRSDLGRFKDHHWVNEEAGNDQSEALGTLWYHDHRHNFTAPNTYKGLVGFYLMFDELDAGDENLNDGINLRLPSGEFDVPLMMGDKLIDSSGALVFDQFNQDGILGNKMTVNGKIQPFFKVQRRKYRFRLLNTGPSRVYGLSLKAATNTVGDMRGATQFQHMTLISFAGNLLRNSLAPFIGPGLLSPAQRADVVVDFSKAAPGETLYLVNEYGQSNGSKPEGFLRNTVNGPQFKTLANGGVPLLRFDVQPGEAPDPSQTPLLLRPLPAMPLGLEALPEATILAAVGKNPPLPTIPKITAVREWRFERTNGQWAINNQLYNGSRATVQIKRGAQELWVLRNDSGGWMHPIHIHFEEFRVLYRANGKKPGFESAQHGREDTMSLGPGERAVIFMQFRDFLGRYVMHCHNTVHEDHAMMIRWDIVE
jgi:FtsP/CotA-like multicopper oxidase with cupredoxin domain